jgi:2-iminobutanoate/2-iminopropanoate deaminase
MPTFLSPSSIARPQIRYSHGGVHNLSGRRLVIAGQVGVKPDGSFAEGREAQMVQAWENLSAVVADAGMEPMDLVKVTAFVTVHGSVMLHRAVRDRMLGDHPPAGTYLEAVSLARPEFLFEEGEAVRERRRSGHEARDRGLIPVNAEARPPRSHHVARRATWLSQDRADDVQVLDPVRGRHDAQRTRNGLHGKEATWHHRPYIAPMLSR